MPKISIIVPVYNMESYLRQCLDSIQNQTFTDWECIMVDDGSTDNSATIVDEYEAKDNRFKAVHRKNGGLSAARNSGLKEATGKYIGFVDSDDWIEPNMYEELHRLITNYNVDMAQVSFIQEYKGISHKKVKIEDDLVLDHKQLVTGVFYDRIIRSYVWVKLFKREVITEPFPEGKVFEDIYTLSHWLPNIKSGVVSPKPLYHYRMRRGSIVNEGSIKSRIQQFESIIERNHLFLRNDPGFVSENERTKVLWKNALNCAKLISRMKNHSLSDRLAALTYVQQICHENLPAPDKNMFGKSKYHKIRLLIDHPKRFIRLMNLTKKLDFYRNYMAKHAYD